jgi:hypothetical protein
MTQYGIYIFLFRFVVNSASSISHCESPISFPRRIEKGGRASTALASREQESSSPSPSREVVNCRYAHRRALPADALSELFLRCPSSASTFSFHHSMYRHR